MDKSFKESALSDFVWKDIAIRKYGRELAESTISHYEGCWKQMIIDDNKKGAMPTVVGLDPCMWRYNTNSVVNSSGLYYCCIISCIKWDRLGRRIRVYLDARGESDLRKPIGTSINCTNDTRTSMKKMRGKWISEMDVDKRGHFKGYLEFHDAFDFEGPGECTFCYANMYHEDGDYTKTELFQFGDEGANLNKFFKTFEGTHTSSDSDSILYTSDQSPFANDAQPGVEMKRWENVVPEAVIQKRGGLLQRKWWV